MKPETIFNLQKLTVLGSGCGSVGRAVASESGGLQFNINSCHCQNSHGTFTEKIEKRRK